MRRGDEAALCCRRFASLTIALLALFPFLSATSLSSPAVQSGRRSGIEFRNGHWWNGSTFDTGTRYAVDQRFASSAPEVILETIDLEGGYAIPPFGEAHNHRPDGWPGTQSHVDQFLEHGIFYVMNQNSFPGMTAELDAEINVPWSIDVLFANGGLTPDGSHVVELYEGNLERGVFPKGWSVDRLDGEGFFIVESEADLSAKWEAVLSGSPDFIKIFMGFSEDDGRRRSDPAFVGKRGIDPALVPLIVARAHAAGLRVSAHIETAEDFRIAVAAGVDMLAHMPGSWRVGEAAGYDDDGIDRWLLTDGDARRAAEAGVVVVAHVANGLRDERIGRIQRHNVPLLKEAGVHLALGSDSYRQTALREAFALQAWDLFTPTELLRLAGEQTARAIYPDRRIGRLEDGFEASFLVIEDDPVARPLFATSAEEPADQVAELVDRIRLRVKQGTMLDRSPIQDE